MTTTRSTATPNQKTEPVISQLPNERSARRNHIRKVLTDLGAGPSMTRDEEIRRIWREAEQAGR